jgi:hypothetical protein
MTRGLGRKNLSLLPLSGVPLSQLQAEEIMICSEAMRLISCYSV